jgi:putative transposase
MEQSVKIIRRRHSPDEIQSKLRLAEKMASQGRRQADIVKALDISVMTYHRWRKTPSALINHVARGSPTVNTISDEGKVKLQLQVENARLRRLVTDLLLENVRLEDLLRLETKHRGRASALPLFRPLA